LKLFFNIKKLTIIFIILGLSGCSTKFKNQNEAQTILPVFQTATKVINSPTPKILPSATLTPGLIVKIEPSATATYQTYLNPIYKNGLLYQFDTVDQKVILTIDDGYSDLTLNKILTMLENKKIHATFFFVGNAVEGSLKYETLKRLIEDGDDIGYHSSTHPGLNTIQKMTKDDWNKDYELWKMTLHNKLGDDFYNRGVVPYSRVPYGDWTKAFMSFCSENNLTPVWWNSDKNTFDKGRVPILKGGIFIIHDVEDDLQGLQKLLDSNWQIFSIRDVMPQTSQ